MTTWVLTADLLTILRWRAERLPSGPMKASELLFPAETDSFRPPSALDKPFSEVGKAIRLRKRIIPRAMWLTFQDLARNADIDAIVRQKSCGHATDEMFDLYSTVPQREIQAAVGTVISLAKYRLQHRESAARVDVVDVLAFEAPTARKCADVRFEGEQSYVGKRGSVARLDACPSIKSLDDRVTEVLVEVESFVGLIPEDGCGHGVNIVNRGGWARHLSKRFVNAQSRQKIGIVRTLSDDAILATVRARAVLPKRTITRTESDRHEIELANRLIGRPVRSIRD